MPPSYLSHPAFAKNDGEELASANRGARGVFVASRCPSPAQIRERMAIIREHNLAIHVASQAKPAVPEYEPRVYSVAPAERLTELEESA